MANVQCYICQKDLLSNSVRKHLTEAKHYTIAVETGPVRCALCYAGDVRQLVATSVQQGKVLVTCKDRCKIVLKTRQFPSAEAKRILVEDEDGIDGLLLAPRVSLCSIFDLRQCEPAQSPHQKKPVPRESVSKILVPEVNEEKEDRWESSVSPVTYSHPQIGPSSSTLVDIHEEPDQSGLSLVPQVFDDKNHFKSIFDKYLEEEEEEDRKKKSAYIKDDTCQVLWRSSGKITGEVVLKSVKDINTGDQLKITDSKKAECKVEIEEIGVSGEPCRVAFTGSVDSLKKDDPTYKLDFALGMNFQARKNGLKKLVKGNDFVSENTANVILGLELPCVHTTSYDLSDVPGLDESQERAILYALNTEFALIQGPPGTGKTKTAAAIIYKLHQISGESVLVCAPSNIAADQLTLTLGEFPGIREKIVRIYAKNRILQGEMGAENFSLHIKVRERLSGRYPHLRSILADKSQRDLTALLLQNNITDNIKEMEKAIVASHSIICCTCATSMSSKLRTHYPYVLIDEAGFASEPESLLPLLRKSSHVVMVGDHKQLPPVVFSKQLAALNYGRSMFERLIEREEMPSQMLTKQYRMHPELAAFPSQRFYKNLLTNGVTADDRIMPAFESFKALYKATSPILYFHISGEEGELDHSFFNSNEIQVVATVLAQLVSAGMAATSIGVISPYEAQRKKLIEFINSHPRIPDKNIEVKNVDGFQGREKDIIVFTSVRSNVSGDIGFLNEFRRLNVAITRAKYGLVMVGNKAVVKRNEDWRKLVEKLEAAKCVREGQSLLALKTSQP